MSRPLLYVAYPMRLDLGAANAIQTYNTVQALRQIIPGMRLVVPRWLRETSAFAGLDALHLPRPAANKLSKLLPWAGWSYLERTLYALMLLILLVAWRLTGHGYKVLYVRDAVCAAWLVVTRDLHGARVIYEVHDLEASHPSKAHRWPRRFWRRFLPWLDRTALTKADHLVSLTTTFKQWAVSRQIQVESDFTVIPDAFDPNRYYPRDTHEARSVLNLPSSAFIIGYAGLTFAYRRLDLLVSAFAALQREFGDILLVLVGGRPQEVAEMRELAVGLGIPGHRLLTPGQVNQEQTPLYLSASDVLVIPDTVTGMTASPLKLFEYMAVGKPIVCKDMPALREILEDRSALFFPEGDVAALVEAIRTLKQNPEKAERLGAWALEHSVQYTYQARAEKIAEVVRSYR